MLHKVLEAKATATDLGEFTALAATYSVDRGKERIIKGAFAGTIERWQDSGKMIPFHWDHSGSPADIIGVVDPASLKETDEGLLVQGRLDLVNSEVAKEAWRAMKSNAVALSFGYMVLNGGMAEDEVYDIREIDLFEISATPAPMNQDTRFIDLKSMQTGGVVPTDVTVTFHSKETVIPPNNVPPPAAEEVEDVSDEGEEPSRKASDPEADQFQLERIRALS